MTSGWDLEREHRGHEPVGGRVERSAARPKVRFIKARLIFETQQSGNFQAYLNEWFAGVEDPGNPGFHRDGGSLGGGEKDLFAFYYQIEGNTHAALILYSE